MSTDTEAIKKKLEEQGWKLLTGADYDIIGDIIKSYSPSIIDQLGLTGFLNLLSASVVYHCPKGWIAFHNILEGLSAEVHGAKFHTEDVTEEAQTLIDAFAMENNCKVIIAPVYSSSKSAEHLAERCGFTLSGVRPFSGTINGEPVNTSIYVKYY